MSRFSLRLPEDLHRRVAAQAHEQGVSINQFLVYAISSAVTEMEARAFFAERAGRYTDADFEAVLGEVAARPPLAGDERLSDSG